MAAPPGTVPEVTVWDSLVRRWVYSASKIVTIEFQSGSSKAAQTFITPDDLGAGIAVGGDGWAKSYLETRNPDWDFDPIQSLFERSLSDKPIPQIDELSQLFATSEFTEIQGKVGVGTDFDILELNAVKLDPELETILTRAGNMNNGNVTGWAVIFQILIRDSQIASGTGYGPPQTWWSNPVEVNLGRDQKVVIGRGASIPEPRPLAILVQGNRDAASQLIQSMAESVPDLQQWSGETYSSPFEIVPLDGDLQVLHLRSTPDILSDISSDPVYTQQLARAIEDYPVWYCPITDNRDGRHDFEASTAINLLEDAHNLIISVGEPGQGGKRFDEVINSPEPGVDDNPDPFLAALFSLDQRLEVNRANPSSSDRPSGDDYLNTNLAAESIALTIAHKKTQTPLAIGIFGPWGSGKSFIMRQIVEALNARNSIAPEDLRGQLVDDIRIIKFNAWTYAKGDLWSAILYEILRQLRVMPEVDKIKRLRSLTEAREMVEEKNRTLAHAKLIYETQRKDSERRIEDHQLRLTAQAASLEELRQLGERSIQEASIVRQEFEAQLERDRSEIDSLRSEGLTETIQAVLPFLGKNSTKSRWAAFGFAVAGLAVTAVVFTTTPDFLDTGYERLIGVATAITGTMSLLTVGLKKFLSRADDVRAKLIGFRENTEDIQKRLASLAGNVSKTGASEIGDIMAQLANTEQDIQSAKDSPKAAEQAMNEAETAALNAKDSLEELGLQRQDTSRSQDLQDFVNSRLADGDYSKRLGHMQRVQEDLAELAGIIGSPKPNDDQDFRIVLLIDDLDRCPPDKVVDVLEAIQLLLAENEYLEERGPKEGNKSGVIEGEDKPVEAKAGPAQPFVVVLGADTRIITRALEEEYKGILDPKRPPTGLDYLEKIIQIPFRVQALDDDKFQGYVSQLTGTGLRLQAGGSGQTSGTDGNGSIVPSPIRTLDPVNWRIPSAVNLFDDDDLRIITGFSRLAADYPRAVKRIVNQYRLCKVMGVTSGSFSKIETAFLLTMASGYRLATSLVISRLDDPTLTQNDTVDSILAASKLSLTNQGTPSNSELLNQEIDVLIPLLTNVGTGNPIPSPFELRAVVRSVVPFLFLGDIDT